MAEQNDIVVRFGRRVRELRQKRKLSQEAFAEKCDLDRTYVGGIERGERNLSLRNIDEIARGLEVSLSELMRAL